MEQVVGVARGEDPAIQTTRQNKPVIPIGNLGKGRGIVLTDTPAHGETTRTPSRNTIEILQQQKPKK